MKYYKKDNKVFAFEEDGTQDRLIEKDMIKMTIDEIEEHTKHVGLTEYYVNLQTLSETDKNMARIAEDIIGALVTKGIVKLSDFPESVAEKLTERKKLREKLRGE